MEGDYPVFLDGQAVGKILVSRRGLYFHFFCRCRISGNRICRLVVRNGNNQENLGIPVPEGVDFMLEKMIPMKRIGEGDLEFQLIPKREQIKGTFVPLCAEEPFRYIERLKDSYMAERSGKKGVVIP